MRMVDNIGIMVDVAYLLTICVVNELALFASSGTSHSTAFSRSHFAERSMLLKR